MEEEKGESRVEEVLSAPVSDPLLPSLKTAWPSLSPSTTSNGKTTLRHTR